MTTSWTALRDGAALGGAATLLVMGSLRANPRLLMRHYPKEMQAHVAPMTKGERGASQLIGLALIALLVGGPWVSTAMLAQARPGSTFGELFVHAFTVGMIPNLVDWLFLDELWLGLVRPRWAMLPGAEELPFRFNHFHHFRGFVVGSGLSAAIAAGVASILTP